MINEFLKLPIVKLIAMIALVFYIFEKTKNDPSSISHQINKENIAKSIDVVKQNMQNISNVKEGIKNYSEDGVANVENSYEVGVEKTELSYQDIRQGIGGAQVRCGSEVEIEYTLMNKINGDIVNKSKMKFDIGSKFNKIIEKALIGMSVGAERIVDIPKTFKTGDNIYDALIQNSSMTYKISLMKVSEEFKSGVVCDE
jgi:FKBP-type peptidyl-prolyl cis-trans isomerase